MKTMNRRRFSLLGLGGFASVALVGCGNEVGEEVAINPTKIPDVPGGPAPTLADMATPGGEAPEDGGESGGETGGGGGEAITLEANDPYNWSTTEITAAPGQDIHVVSAAMLPHNFEVDGIDGVLVDLPANGAEGTWTVPADAAVGTTFTYFCGIPGHREAGMEGVLTVGEAPAGGGGAEASPAAEATPAGAAQPEGAAPPAAGGGEPITLEAKDPYNWSTNEISAAPGQVIHVVSAAMLPHNFEVDGIDGVLVDLPSSGAAGDWPVPADAAPGTTFTYFCGIPGHREAGMEGVITVG